MRWPLAIAIVASMAPSAQAAVVGYEFTGEVTALIGGGGKGLFGAPGSVSLGDSFTGRFSYDAGPSNVDQEPGDADVGIYDLIGFEVDGTALDILGGTIAVLDSSGPVLPPATPPPDRFVILLDLLASPYASTRVAFSLSAPASLFLSDALPGSLDFSDFTAGRLAGIDAVGITPAPSIEDAGVVTGLTALDPLPAVPAPGGLPLLLSSLAALIWARRRPRQLVAATSAP